jgi:hypothetical protein
MYKPPNKPTPIKAAATGIAGSASIEGYATIAYLNDSYAKYNPRLLPVRQDGP